YAEFGVDIHIIRVDRTGYPVKFFPVLLACGLWRDISAGEVRLTGKPNAISRQLPARWAERR
ncbi:MAG: hypothetical protein D3924_20320, partial [Candidatus Electrothrix sp. AR4]|nr:hypothetical protein [Candidatus Electrothrix sp. AR4]